MKTKNNPRRCFALTTILLSLASLALAQDAPPDLILHHGKIATVDERFTIAEALAIRGERLVAVGTNADVLRLKGEKTEVVDLQGKFVIPGLMDSHTHAIGAAMHEFDHSIPDMESIDDVLAYVRSRAAALPEGEWISIRQVFITRLKDPRYPTRAELDAAAPKHPVVFSTGPDAMLNSLALQKSGIDKDFKATGTGTIEKDPATGEPTGLLRNSGHHIKSESSEKSASADERRRRVIELFADYNAVGITAIADRNASDGGIGLYQKLREDKELTVRVVCSYGIDGGSKIESLRQKIAEVGRHPLRQANPWVRIVGLKCFLDGGMLTGSAYMRQPWGVSRIYSITDPDYRGIRFIEPEKLEQMVEAAVENDLQFTAHSVGDGAIHTLLEAYEKVNARRPIRDTRPCLTHSNFMSREACELMPKLGVVADIQPAWLFLDAHTLRTQFGDERLRYFQPLKTLFANGAIVGGGSDHMQKIGSLRSVNPYNPFLAMWTTLTRRGRWLEGQLHPEEALTREQALRFYTGNNAYVMFLEQETGALVPGKLADLVILDRDLLACPVDDIRTTEVLATYVGGKKVFAKK